MPGHRALGRRATWVMADQGLSSICNFVMSTVVARSVSAAEFGAFALVFATYSFLISVAGGMSSQVVAIRFAGTAREDGRGAAATAVGLTIAFGGVCGVGSVVVASTLGGSSRGALLAFACVVPMLLTQECWRSLFVALGRPQQALVNSVFWVTALAGLLIAVRMTGTGDAWPFVLAWGGSAGVGALVGLVQFGRRPVFTGLGSWLKAHRDLIVPIQLSTAATLGCIQVVTVLIASLGTLQQVGAIRGAQTLLGPIGVVAIAAQAFVTPEVSRRVLGRRQLVYVALGLSGLLVLVTSVWGGLLLLLPDSLGEKLLGQTWEGARQALPGMTIYVVGIAAIAGATTVLKSLARANLAMVSSLVLGVMIVLVPPVGIVVDGAAGAAYGFGVAALAVFVPTWLLFVRGLRLGRQEEAVSPR